MAVTQSGDIVVSGSGKCGFPVTPGAYNFAGPATLRPYLLKLDSTGTAVRFSAYGIGGNALATDSSGNIFMAGSTVLLDYPTTTDQPTLKQVSICFGLCQIGFAATNQYLKKVDPAGSKLIYSTGVAGGGPNRKRRSSFGLTNTASAQQPLYFWVGR